jgi:hypothetical protein
MFGLRQEIASDDYGFFSDLLADSASDLGDSWGDFSCSSSSGRSEILSSAPSESENRCEQPIENDIWRDYVLYMDDSDIDKFSGLDGEREWTSMRAAQIRIKEEPDEDITPHAQVNGQATKPAWCTGFFFDAYIC